MNLSSLYPIPGGKSDRKYDKFLYPSMQATTLAEPFMGGAAKSIQYSHLPTYLGEINPAQRAIALALHNPDQYIQGYQEAYDRFWSGHSDSYAKVLSFAGLEKAQSALSVAIPEIYAALTANWRAIATDLYEWMHSTPDSRLAGYYAFCIRACFGNVMRLTPSGTHFNVTWHVDKLTNACQYDPQQWLDGLRAINWKPNVFDCWEKAIAAVPDPSSTFLLLDPPYICSDTAKMTPCYPGHKVTTKDGMATTFALAVDSLQAGLERGFESIAVCNYYDPQLDAAIKELVSDAGYSATTDLLGECKALGNSNGRRVHGNRVDKRSRPVEVIYRLDRVKQRQWSGFKPQVGSQLSLLEVAA